jgi:uncharacterized protein (DUF4213/DUF364 family)
MNPNLPHSSQARNDMLDALQACAREKAHNKTLLDVRIGLYYTAVLLDDGAAGVAYTFRNEIASGTGSFRGVRPLAGKKAIDVIAYITSSDLCERTVGIATANALINREHQEQTPGDILDVLSPGKDDTIGMVGYFRPLVPHLKAACRRLLIFEQDPTDDEGVFPADRACEMLPSCSISLITSTSLINKTLNDLLLASQNCKTIALVGSSTPLAREVFSAYGVTILSGVVITDPHSILRIVSEGSGMRSFKGSIKKVNVI